MRDGKKNIIYKPGRTGGYELPSYANESTGEFIAEAFSSGRRTRYGRQLRKIIELHEKGNPNFEFGASPDIKASNKKEAKKILQAIERIK